MPREIAPVCARQSEGLRYSDLTLREKFLGIVEVVAGHWMRALIPEVLQSRGPTAARSSSNQQHCRALQPLLNFTSSEFMKTVLITLLPGT